MNPTSETPEPGSPDYLASADPSAKPDPDQFDGEPWWDDAESVETFFENGQWWLRATFDNDDQPERTWSLADCETPYGDAYLDLEEI